MGTNLVPFIAYNLVLLEIIRVNSSILFIGTSNKANNMTIQQQFEEMINSGIIPMFEIPVIDKRTGKNDYVIFDISISVGEIIAQHVALNSDEEKSEKIAFKSIEIDEDFSLDEHLQDLHEEIWHAINDSEFFQHTNED